MPREYRDELIRLYAGNRIAAIDAVAGFQQLRGRFAQDVDFQTDRHEIETAKTWVEAALGERMTQQESVQKAIELLVQTRGRNKQRDLCHELIVVGYKPRWTAAQQEYFEHAWERIKLEFDYFLSFTSRYPSGVAGDNPVNTSYKQFIISEITVDEFKKADRKKTNLLALAVHRLLSQPRIKGFYFPHSQYDNTLTEQKLKAACDSCLVFVQLVQGIMFDPPAETNYCFFEWSQVNTRFQGADREKHMLFVVAEPSRNDFLALLPFAGYKDWHNHVRQKDPPYLPEMQFRDDTTLKKIRSTFQHIIVPEIRAAWFRLVEGAP